MRTVLDNPKDEHILRPQLQLALLTKKSVRPHSYYARGDQNPIVIPRPASKKSPHILSMMLLGFPSTVIYTGICNRGQNAESGMYDDNIYGRWPMVADLLAAS